MLPIGDSAMQVIEYALDGLNLRSEVISDNVANAGVPGFKPSKVDFEATLRRALRTGNISSLRETGVTETTGVVQPNGNEVSLEDEVVEMLKTNLVQDAMVNAFNFKVAVLRSAIRG
jgi:flagellar basal-body rod protein FlgB